MPDFGTLVLLARESVVDIDSWRKRRIGSMTTEAVKIQLQVRDVIGKKVKRLRQEGIIPVHLYGPEIESRALQCAQKEIVRALASSGGTTPITVSVDGESDEQLTFAREVQWHPVRGDILHVDFLAVAANQKVTSQVPLVLTGESLGARLAGGTAALQMREILVEALPLDIPSEIEVDINGMTETSSVVRAGDVKVPSNITIVTDSEEMVVRIEVTRPSQPMATDGGAAEEAATDSSDAGGSADGE